MNCHDIQKLMPIYLDDALEPNEMKEVKIHVDECALCQKEMADYKASWDMLGEWEDIQPSPNYVSRFWTELSLQKKWYEKVWEVIPIRELINGIGIIKEKILQKHLVPVLATACVIVIVSAVAMQNYSQEKGAREILAHWEVIDMEMVENIELAENLDVIQDLEFWEDWGIIESLDV